MLFIIRDPEYTIITEDNFHKLILSMYTVDSFLFKTLN